MSEYINMRRVSYDCGKDGMAVFVPVCPKCGRFVKSNNSIYLNWTGELRHEPNATCKRCGAVEMLFEGFFSPKELRGDTP